jgi:hypothetical protein
MYRIFVEKQRLMTKIYSLFILVSMFAFSFNANSQCTPDPTCTDLLTPGEICPATLPDGTVGTPYSQVVTVIPPATAAIGTGGATVTIYQIILDSVGNMPPGLTYQPSSGGAFVVKPSTDVNYRYCILISGTPLLAGTYPLSIYVTPWIHLFGNTNVPSTQQVDDTSLAIVIHPNSTGYSIVNMNKFSVLNSKPNPFSYTSKIGFISPNSCEVKLNVFDVVGNLIYNEKMTATRGENYFDFNGMKLGKGIYFYTITNGKESFTKQLIKN